MATVVESRRQAAKASTAAGRPRNHDGGGPFL